MWERQVSPLLPHRCRGRLWGHLSAPALWRSRPELVQNGDAEISSSSREPGFGKSGGTHGWSVPCMPSCLACGPRRAAAEPFLSVRDTGRVISGESDRPQRKAPTLLVSGILPLVAQPEASIPQTALSRPCN